MFLRLRKALATVTLTQAIHMLRALLRLALALLLLASQYQPQSLQWALLVLLAQTLVQWAEAVVITPYTPSTPSTTGLLPNDPNAR